MTSADWVFKLNVECIDEDDGSMSIVITWDETDPDLDYWNSLGEDGQHEFIWAALETACNNILEIEDTNDGI
jgi:hypothetical protein